MTAPTAHRLASEVLGTALMVSTVVGSGIIPAVTIGTALSDTFAGIAPGDVAAFIAPPCVGRLGAWWVAERALGYRTELA